MDDLSLITMHDEIPMAPILERLCRDAVSAADALEATAAEIGEAIDAMGRMDPAAGALMARLRHRRSWLMAEVAALRDTIGRQDDAITARMAAALIAEFNRAERVSLVPPPFRVVK